jgi:hypothetical protein
MTSIRRIVLLAGAAAFLSSQAAHAAPAPSIDPLVSLAVLAGGQAHSAVCAGSTAATAAATAAAQAPAPGCVLPVTAPPPAAPVAEAVPPPPPPPIVEAGAPKTIGTLPILLGLAAIIGVIALIVSGNDNGNGEVTPISPA